MSTIVTSRGKVTTFGKVVMYQIGRYKAFIGEEDGEPFVCRICMKEYEEEYLIQTECRLRHYPECRECLKDGICEEHISHGCVVFLCTNCIYELPSKISEKYPGYSEPMGSIMLYKDLDIIAIINEGETIYQLGG